MRTYKGLTMLAFGLAIAICASPVLALSKNWLATPSSSGLTANAPCNLGGISASGRFVVFQSNASNLDAGLTDGLNQVYVYDRETGYSWLASISSDLSTDADADSGDNGFAMSADGRIIAFDSTATNLVGGITNGTYQLFVHDMNTDTSECVSVASDGTPGDYDSYYPTLSSDGHVVAFESWATNLTSAQVNSFIQVFAYDRQTKKAELISATSAGAVGNGTSVNASISGNGRFVGFVSNSTNLVAQATGSSWQAYVRDRQTGTNELVSVSSSGVPGNNQNAVQEIPSLSDDGRFVAFQSFGATNLVPGVTTDHQIYVRDRQAGTTEIVSVSTGGTPANGLCGSPSISGSGRFVVFESFATNLAAGATDGHDQVYMHDRLTGKTQLISATSSGVKANDTINLFWPYISADGKYAAFQTDADNLVTDQDPGGVQQVYLHRLNPPSLLAGAASDGSIHYTTDFSHWVSAPGRLASMSFADFSGDNFTGLAGLNSNGSIWQIPNMQSAIQVPGYLARMLADDFSDDGKDDIIGLSSNGSIWYTTDEKSWTSVPGFLAAITDGDLMGNGIPVLAGLSSNGSIWYTVDFTSWSKVPGYLAKLVVGDFNGDGYDDFAGLSADGSIWYTTDLQSWTKVPGFLKDISTGDLNGDGKDDLVGLSNDGSVWYTTNLTTWTKVPGSLSKLVVGDFNGDGKDDLAGLSNNGSTWYTTNLQTWTSIPSAYATLVSSK